MRLLSLLFGCVVINYSLGLVFAQRSQSQNNNDPLLFYIYQGDAFFPDLCREEDNTFAAVLPRSYYFDVMDFWLRDLEQHPWRTTDPELADMFFIPFNMDDSFAAGDCKGVSHYTRVKNVVQAIAASSTYRKHFGWDHVWPIGHYRLIFRGAAGLFPHGYKEVLSNMTITRFMDWKLALGQEHYGLTYVDAAGKDYIKLANIWRMHHFWRCTVSTPIYTPNNVWEDDTNLSFEKWKQRELFFHYRGKGRNCSSYGTAIDVNDLRYAATDGWKRPNYPDPVDVIPNSIFSHERAPGDSYGTELKSSRFCLVLRCDDPLASRFYDAIAAGCIPVLISDGWLLTVAPFVEKINYHSFSIIIPESIYWYDAVGALRFAYNHEESHLQTLYENLLQERKKLLWRHNERSVATLSLQQIKSDCLTPPFKAFNATTLDDIKLSELQ